MAGKIYVAAHSAVIYTEDDGPVTIQANVTRVREGHPLLKGNEALFRELDVQYEVETARQAPTPEAKPEPVKRSTKQPESHKTETASHEGPASIGASHGGEASEAGTAAGSGSASDAEAESKSAPRKTASAPRRGPRKTS
jgi:hypothetical protein